MKESLLQRVSSGEPQAVQDCIDRYSGLVWSLARRFLRGCDEAEDAVQEIFIELWKSAGRFDPAVAAEATFVAMLARRRLIDRCRRQLNRPQASAASLDDIADRGSSDAGLQSLDLQEDAGLATEAFKQLRSEEQSVLRLAVFQGWSHQSIADSLSLPLGTVKTHVRRGLMRVRDVLMARDATQGKEAAS